MDSAERERSPRGAKHSGTFDRGVSERHFGPYVVERVLRRGGTAEVLQAHRDDEPARVVAIKRLLPEFVERPDRVAMFLDEVRLSERLRHPDIVRVLGSGQVEEQPYLVLEHVDGPSLGSLLRACRARDEKVPVPIACLIARRVLLALEYVHRLRDEEGEPLSVVHRDVTPDNVLIGFDGSVKLADFGHARSSLQNQHTEAGLVKGTTAYLSPEQAGAQPVDHRSDVWNVGVLLYEMLAGEHLFLAEDDATTLARVKSAEIPSLLERNPDVSAALEAVVLRALRREPDDRFDSAAQMVQQLVQSGLGTGSGEHPELAAWARALVGRSGAGDADTAPHPSSDDDSGLEAFDDVAPVSTVSAVLDPDATVQTQPAVLPEGESDDALEAPTTGEFYADEGDVESLDDADEADDEDTAAADQPAEEEAGERGARPIFDGVVPAFEQDDDADEPTQVRAMPPSWLQATRGGAQEAPAPAPWSSLGKPSPFPPSAPASGAPTPSRAPHPSAARLDETARRIDHATTAVGTTGAPGLAELRAALERVDSRMVFAIGLALLLAIALPFVWPKDDPAVIQLTTVPAEANVLLDGVTVSTNSPHILSSVTTDRPHVLAVQRAGYVGWHTTLQLRPGQVLTMPEVVLWPSSVEPGGPGAQGAVDEADSPQPEGDQRAPAAASPSPASRGASGANGTLRINSRPWSVVHVDGRPVGNTPQTNLSLPPGSHRILLVNPDLGLRKQLTVRIRPGKVETQVVDLASAE